MRKLIGTAALALAASAMVATPVLAQEQKKSNTRQVLGRLLDTVLGPEEKEEAAAEAAATEGQQLGALQQVLADDRRDEDRARDKYRNPAETLAFFQVEPGMTVAEYGPGGGWYTRVLAPYIAPEGRYVALTGDTEMRTFRDADQEAEARAWPSTFPAAAAETTGVAAERISAFETDEVPEALAGSIDRVLIFRSMHGLWNANMADSELKNIHSMLADDGMVGVVQHRAPADASYADVNPARGYMRQSDVIKLFELHGFELVGSSEINANPKDPANWEGGVWTLPPVLRYGEANRDAYLAIGESDRMTLLFKKAD